MRRFTKHLSAPLQQSYTLLFVCSTLTSDITSRLNGTFLFTLGMQGTLRLWMLALPWAATAVVTPGSAGYLLWECCILASL